MPASKELKREAIEKEHEKELLKALTVESLMSDGASTYCW